MNIPKHLVAGGVLISFLIFNCFSPKPEYGVIFWSLSILTGYLFFLDHKEKERVQVDRVKAIQEEFQKRVDDMDKIYARKIDKLEDDLGKLSISMVGGRQNQNQPTPSIKDVYANKKIQF